MELEYQTRGMEMPITILRANEFLKMFQDARDPANHINKGPPPGFAIVKEIKQTFENQIEMLKREKEKLLKEHEKEK